MTSPNPAPSNKKYTKLVLLGCLLLLLPACSTQRATVPFHIYNSPLVEAEIRPPDKQSSDYDPFGGGDYQLPEEYYASNTNGSRTDATKSPVSPKSSKQSSPVTEPARATAHAKGASSTVQHEVTQARPRAKNTTQPAKQANPQRDAGRSPLAAQFVYETYFINNVKLPKSSQSSVPELYRACRDLGRVHHEHRPLIGDMVFFHNTFDANEDGRNNDWYTEAGVVEAIRSDGTLDILMYRNGAVSRAHMNLQSPERSTFTSGRIANTQLRQPTSGDASHTQYLAGQLFAGFCSLLGNESEFVVVDNWTPEMRLVH